MEGEVRLVQASNEDALALELVPLRCHQRLSLFDLPLSKHCLHLPPEGPHLAREVEARWSWRRGRRRGRLSAAGLLQGAISLEVESGKFLAADVRNAFV